MITTPCPAPVPGSKVQRAESLFRVVQDRTDAHNHQSLAVLGKGILQQVRQCRVSERNVALFGRSGCDDVTQCGEGFVDVLGLLQSLARGT